jgi:hypothetical protein
MKVAQQSPDHMERMCARYVSLQLFGQSALVKSILISVIFWNAY